MCQSYIRNVINIFQHKRAVLRRCRVTSRDIPDRCRTIRRRSHCGRGGPRGARRRPATLPVSPGIAACRASAIPAAASRNQLQRVGRWSLTRNSIHINRTLEDRGCPLRALTPQPRHLFQSDFQLHLGFVELPDHFLVRTLRHDDYVNRS